MIEVENLTKRFGTHVAVDSLSFRAPEGAATAFLGPNGAGKTTTFRMLLGLAAPSEGAALIDGVPFTGLNQPRQKVGAVLESSGFHPARTAANHLRIICTAAALPRSRANEVLSFVGLKSAADRRVGEFSMGMRQRLALAGALLGDPPVLVLDEPTNGLDPEGISWLRSLIHEWKAEGRCVLVSSHLLAEVSQAVDRVVIVKEGRVLHEQDISELENETVLVETDEAALLVNELSAKGIDARLGRHSEVTVTGYSARRIAALAGARGITLHGLKTQQREHALEELFLSLTSDDQQANV